LVLEHGPNFGGVWQDQLGGGDIVVAAVDASRVDSVAVGRAAGNSDNVRIVEVEHSWAEIDSMRDALVDKVAARGLDANVLINSTGIGRQLEIVTPTPELIDASLLALAPEDLVTTTKADTAGNTGGPSGTHSAGDQQAGLQVEFDPGYSSWCTWGMSGHTSSYNYIVTAGHCGASTYKNFSGWSYAFEMQENDVFELTPGASYVHSFDAYNKDEKRVSSQYADNNCYHATVHCGGFFRYRAVHNSWEVGADTSCASLGTSNAWECGLIQEENYTGSGDCAGNRWVRIGVTTIPGDSGSGFVYWSGSGIQLAIDALQHCGGAHLTWTAATTAY